MSLLPLVAMHCLLAAPGAAPSGEFPRPLLGNADFEQAAPGSAWPEGWPKGSGVHWVAEEGNRFLRFEVTRPDTTASIARAVKLKPQWGTLRVSCRVRYHDIVPGKEGWHDGRIAMSFTDDAGRRVGPWPNVLHWHGSSPGWAEESREFVIPEGATQVSLGLALFSVQRGTLDLDDVQVTVLRPRPKPEDAPLPASWQPAVPPAWQQRGPVREVLCLNGPWQFRPMGLGAEPAELSPTMIETPPPLPTTPGWGWTKLPAAWPDTPGDGHEPVIPEFWRVKRQLRDAAAYWYRRTLDIPAGWAGRRIVLSFDLPQTRVAVQVNGKPAGLVTWPAGQVELSKLVTPGRPATLALFVTAEPFAAEHVSAAREDLLTKSKALVRFRGPCGDIFLQAEPHGPRLADVRFEPSVRNKQLGLHLTLADAGRQSLQIRLAASLGGQVEKRWTSPPQAAGAGGVIAVSVPWLAQHLWDLDAPHLYDVELQLLSADGTLLDEIHRRLGFREVWINGRDVVLNGMPIHWRALDFSNHLRNLAAASKPQCAATFQRMRRLGFNFAILANYDVEPGETGPFGPLLDAADEQGFLLSFTMPHPFHFLGQSSYKLYQTPAWRKVVEYCAATAGNHPSVLAYAMSHNSLGYHGDQNPAKMDGIYQPHPADAAKSYMLRNRDAAAAAEIIVRGCDPTRLVYHHQSGNMGAWHTVNIYLNWAPLQERIEWLSHWAEAGVKPLFFVEWGPPHQASWGRHRVGPFIWRNNVSSEPLAVEYGAAITGEAAYDLTEAEEQHIDNYQRVYDRGQPFHIAQVLGDYWEQGREHNFIELKSHFTRLAWPALRTWGISAILPWDQADVARRKPGTGGSAHVIPFDEPAAAWNTPGIHPDRVSTDGDYFNAGDPDNFEASSIGQTYRRVNDDVLLWIAGRPEQFTEQSHQFRPGETIHKQLIVLNDTRGLLKGHLVADVRLGEKTKVLADELIEVPPGWQRRVPFSCQLPADPLGIYHINARLYYGVDSPWTGHFFNRRQSDQFTVEVLPPVQPPHDVPNVVLWDPKGLTAQELTRLAVNVPALTGPVPTSAKGLLVGREAIGLDGALPDIGPLLARGGRVVVFEQTEQALSRRLGFRTNAPSLRTAFLRTFHPIVQGLSNAQLHDWTGDATLLPDRYTLPDFELNDPQVDWLGFKNTRAWKWGNSGQLASVVIEKPQTGDFLTLVDGGFDLQYAALMVARIGNGQMVFCQLDVTGRSQPDPAADRLLGNLVQWAGWMSPVPWTPSLIKPASFAGDAATLKFLQSLGADLVKSDSPPPPTGASLDVDAAGRSVPERMRLLLFQDAASVAKLEGHLETRPENITHTAVPASQMPTPWLDGIGPAELHFRGRTPLLGVFPSFLSTGVITRTYDGQTRVVICQVDPRQFDYQQPGKIYLKLTHNRTCTLLARLLANCGVPLNSRLAEYWKEPPPAQAATQRWLQSYYLDTPIAEDDPYRYNRW